MLRRRLASGRPLTDPESWPVRAALVLTDIEGWTASVERLSSAGPEGLDELARSLNSYFVLLAETVYGLGGDLLTGTGDAFLCCWLAEDDEDLVLATARAARAALTFQALSSRRPDAGRLRTRIGIATGELEVGLVGGVNGRWELLPVGDPLEHVAHAERSAPAGSVVLARSAWQHIADQAQGTELADGGLFALTELATPPMSSPFESPPLPLAPDAIAPFVPAPMREWRRESGEEWLAELRRVIVVMTRLLDDAGSPTSDLALSHAAVRALQETIVRFEGASKAGMDSKGLTLSAVFGLPPRAHEDDAERAVRAAAALRSRLAALGLPCSVGVASGRAFCGLFGCDLRREYSLHGDVMNLAARLAYAGHDQILCDESTARAVSERFRFEELPAIALKGRTEPVPARALVGINATTGPRHPGLVDRERERALIGERLQALAQRGERGMIVIEGDAGIGKSAVVAEAARLAERAGVRVLTAAADAVERATGYYAWRPLFVDALDLDGDTAAESASVRRRVLERIGGPPEVERLVPLLSSVLATPIADNEVTAAMTGEARADNTTMLLTRILSRITAISPVMVIVEDAHWLDSNSWSLLREVVQTVPRLLALVTTRPIAIESPARAELLALIAAEPLRLGTLAPEHTAALVRQRLGVSDVPVALSRFVEDRVAGHPFFCEALLKTMQERGVVRVQDGATLFGELEGLDVPSTVEGAVLSLVDRLTPEQQLSLKVAAVVGRTFSIRVVSQAHPVASERAAVPDDLRVLASLDLVVAQDADGEPAYAFRHEITREVAYGLLTESQRRPLHRAVAEWYERDYTPQELEPHDELLAYHWSEADDPAKAIPYLERAGRGALRSGAFREAALFYERLRSQARRSGARASEAQRALWDKGEAAAYYFLGDFDRSRMLLERAVARLDRPVPKGRRPIARGLAATVAQQLAHLALPARYRERRRSERALLQEAVDCYKTLVQISYLDGESTGELMYFMFAGLNLGEEVGSSPQLARALANAAGVISLFNLRGLADRYAARAVQMADQEGQSEALAYVWNVNALIAAQRGAWRQGIGASDRALEVFGEIGDYNLEAELWQTRSALHICAGDFLGAEACWARTRELADRNANPQLECWSLLDEAQTHYGRGATEQAAVALEAALAIPTARSDRGTLIEKSFTSAITRLRQGAPAAAIAGADEVLAMVRREVPTGFHWAEFAAGAVEVQLELLERARTTSDRDALERRARDGCATLRRISKRFHGIAARRWLLQGTLEWELGHSEQARLAWRRAEAVATAMGIDYDLVRAHVELLRHGVAGPDAARLGSRAIQTLDRLGATHYLKIVQAL
jgi:class 3 adenylate cyclase/tetratricopeptide (TPR) repeat protein